MNEKTSVCLNRKYRDENAFNKEINEISIKYKYIANNNMMMMMME